MLREELGWPGEIIFISFLRNPKTEVSKNFRKLDFERGLLAAAPGGGANGCESDPLCSSSYPCPSVQSVVKHFIVTKSGLGFPAEGDGLPFLGIGARFAGGKRALRRIWGTKGPSSSLMFYGKVETKFREVFWSTDYPPRRAGCG